METPSLSVPLLPRKGHQPWDLVTGHASQLEDLESPIFMDPLFFQALGDRVSLDPGSLSQDCWQEKSGSASVLVTRFSREEALMSGQGFILLLMLQKTLCSPGHSLLNPYPQLYLCLMRFLARAEKLELEEMEVELGRERPPRMWAQNAREAIVQLCHQLPRPQAASCCSSVSISI